ncbi:predicted ORF [Xanthomonas phage XacN1]|nr:predicted ORF [Xanthomonas phage XacN1]
MKHNIFDNGVLNYAEMKRVSYEGAISEAIRRLNNMWGEKTRYGYRGYFSICDVTSVASALGKAWTHSGTEYNYLCVFHCKNWSQITEISREGLAAVVIAYLNNSRIGYDRETEKFIDLKTTEVAAPEKMMTKEPSIVSKLIAKLLNRFRKSKA